MKSPKPKHEAIAGHVRLTLFGSNGHAKDPATLTIERRRESTADNWYPAATFPIGELAEIEQAVRDMKSFVEVPPGSKPPAKPKPNPAPPPPAPAPESDPNPDSSEPPFEPTSPVSAAAIDPSPGRAAKPTARKTERKPKTKTATRQFHPKSKARSR